MKIVAVIPDPRAARSLRFSLRFARTVDGYHPSRFAGLRGSSLRFLRFVAKQQSLRYPGKSR